MSRSGELVLIFGRLFDTVVTVTSCGGLVFTSCWLTGDWLVKSLLLSWDLVLCNSKKIWIYCHFICYGIVKFFTFHYIIFQLFKSSIRVVICSSILFSLFPLFWSCSIVLVSSAAEYSSTSLSINLSTLFYSHVMWDLYPLWEAWKLVNSSICLACSTINTNKTNYSVN